MNPNPVHIDLTRVQTAAEFGQALSRLRQEANLTVRELAKKAGLPSHSTVGGYLTGRHLPYPTRPDVMAALLEALDVSDPPLDAWMSTLRRLSGHRVAPELEGMRPYPGLRPFTESEAPLLFGREAETAGLRALVAGLTAPDVIDLTDDSDQGQRGARADGDGIAVLVGPSGSGKSSLVTAGLLPVLGLEWSAVAFRPGPDPASALAEVLTGLSERAPRNLIVVDQAEELWTRGDDATRSAFFDALSVALKQTSTAVLVVMRADFLVSAAVEPALLPALKERQYLLGPMSEEQLAAAIIGPAGLFALSLDPGLEERLITDASTDARLQGSPALPLLCHCLSAMDEARTGRQLTHSLYESVGRLAGAVAATADNAYDELTESQQAAARDLLLRLVVVEPGLPPVASDLPRGEWDRGPDDQEVRERLLTRRLLTVRDDKLRLSHEALISAWPRLAQWIEEDEEHLRTSRMVARESQLWEATSDPDFLLRGGRLAGALSTQEQRPALFSQPGRAFLSASKQAEDATAQQQHQALRRTRRLLAVVSVLAVSAIVAGIALAFSQSALARERDEALADQLAAQSQVNATTDPVLYSQLALASYRVRPTVSSRSAVIEAAAAPATSLIDGPLGLRLVAAHGDMLAAGGEDTNLRLFDVSGSAPRLLATVPAPTAEGGEASLYAAAFTRDGSTLVVGGKSGKIRIWDVSEPRRPKVVGGDIEVGAAVHSLAIDEADVLTATAYNQGIRRWNLKGQHPVELPAISVKGPDGAPAPVKSVAALTDGSVVVGTENGKIGRWLPDSGGTVTASVDVGTRGVNSILESPVGVLAGLDHSKIVTLTPTADGLQLQAEPFATLGNQVHSMSLSPDSTRLAVSTGDGFVTVLGLDGKVLEEFQVGDVAGSVTFVTDHRLGIGVRNGRTLVRDIPAYPAPDRGTRVIYAVGMSDDGSKLLAPVYVGGDLDVTFYTRTHEGLLREQVRIQEPESNGRFLGTATLSPSGRLAVAGVTRSITNPGAAATSTATLRIWKWEGVGNPQYLTATDVGEGALNFVEFVNDETLLVTMESKVLLLSITSEGAVTVLDEFVAPEGQGSLMDSDVSVSGTVGAVGAAGKVYVWKRGAGSTPLSVTDWDGYLYGIAFSPDGDQVAITGTPRAVRIYDATDPTRLTVSKTLPGFSGTGILMDYRADGHLLVVAESGEATVWDGGHDYLPVLAVHEPSKLQVGAWSADGAGFLVAGNGGLIRDLSFDEDAAATGRCARMGDELPADQWAGIAPDLRTPLLCP